jgi:beta-lactamase regulating signal transducer with metallopeptidase domain
VTLVETWVQTPLAQAIGWTLVHSLWEGAVVALVLAAALWAIRSSRARYAAACLAMLAMLAGFGFTFARLIPRQRSHVVTIANAGSALFPAGFEEPKGLVPRSAADFLPWLAPFWMAGVVIFHLRSLASWMAARRLRRTGVCLAPDIWRERLDRLGARVRLSRPVTLLESCLAEVPVVIGYVRPAILMPVGLLAGLPAGQIESILLHELAHIRRYDYLVNLLQASVEGFLFYHPAVWWISGLIRAERENCCDDLVVATHGDAHEYAAALAALEQNRWSARQAAPAATGGNLMQRIRRLLNRRSLDGLAAAATSVTPACHSVYQVAHGGRRVHHHGPGTRGLQGPHHRCRARDVHRAVLAAPRPHSGHRRKRIQRGTLPAHCVCQRALRFAHSRLEDRPRPDLHRLRTG